MKESQFLKRCESPEATHVPTHGLTARHMQVALLTHGFEKWTPEIERESWEEGRKEVGGEGIGGWSQSNHNMSRCTTTGKWTKYGMPTQ